VCLTTGNLNANVKKKCVCNLNNLYRLYREFRKTFLFCKIKCA